MTLIRLAVPGLVVCLALSAGNNNGSQAQYVGGTISEIQATLVRLIDYLKTEQITSVFTHLMAGTSADGDTQTGISSLMDTWIALRNEPGVNDGRRLVIIKSRGMHHAAEEQRFRITNAGVSSGPGSVGRVVTRGRPGRA